MSEQATIPIGTLFRGRYEVQSLLGKGGFGTTYLVLDHERFKRKCVLKELLPRHKGDQKVRELFEREARTLDRLDHPGIPRLEAFFILEDHYYLVEAFVDGENLAELLERRGPLPEPEVVKIAAEILEILVYLHGLTPPVIHRDINPRNLMITPDGHCKLIDFGAVREAMSASTVLEGDGTKIGSPGYMAPEQHHGHAFPASDLYALGATLLHLLTGQSPAHWYDAHEGRWTYAGHINASANISRILDKLLAELVRNRYGSAGEVLQDLGGNKLDQGRRIEPVPKRLPFKKLAVVGALIVAILYWYLQPPSVEIESIRFFVSNVPVQTQIGPTASHRSDYKKDFVNNVPRWIVSEIRLSRPTSQDIAVDVVWRFPKGDPAIVNYGIKPGSQGLLMSRGFSGSPNWQVGRYVVEVVRNNVVLAKAEFNMSAPPPNYDIPSIQANVVGAIRFYEGPAPAPQLDQRRYQAVFDAKSTRYIWCEVRIKNMAALAQRRFTIEHKWAHNGIPLTVRNYEFDSPPPGQERIYSVAHGSNTPGWTPGIYTVELFVANKRIGMGSVTVR